ncbi:hypothetical protein ACFL2K_00820 [Candidatus Margulisiibacteriota bacterium]
MNGIGNNCFNLFEVFAQSKKEKNNTKNIKTLKPSPINTQLLKEIPKEHRISPLSPKSEGKKEDTKKGTIFINEVVLLPKERGRSKKKTEKKINESTEENKVNKIPTEDDEFSSFSPGNYLEGNYSPGIPGYSPNINQEEDGFFDDNFFDNQNINNENEIQKVTEQEKVEESLEQKIVRLWKEAYPECGYLEDNQIIKYAETQAELIRHIKWYNEKENMQVKKYLASINWKIFLEIYEKDDALINLFQNKIEQIDSLINLMLKKTYELMPLENKKQVLIEKKRIENLPHYVRTYELISRIKKNNKTNNEFDISILNNIYNNDENVINSLVQIYNPFIYFFQNNKRHYLKLYQVWGLLYPQDQITSDYDKYIILIDKIEKYLETYKEILEKQLKIENIDDLIKTLDFNDLAEIISEKRSSQVILKKYVSKNTTTNYKPEDYEKEQNELSIKEKVLQLLEKTFPKSNFRENKIFEQDRIFVNKINNTFHIYIQSLKKLPKSYQEKAINEIAGINQLSFFEKIYCLIKQIMNVTGNRNETSVFKKISDFRVSGQVLSLFFFNSLLNISAATSLKLNKFRRSSRFQNSNLKKNSMVDIILYLLMYYEKRKDYFLKEYKVNNINEFVKKLNETQLFKIVSDVMGLSAKNNQNNKPTQKKSIKKIKKQKKKIEENDNDVEIDDEKSSSIEKNNELQKIFNQEPYTYRVVSASGDGNCTINAINRYVKEMGLEFSNKEEEITRKAFIERIGKSVELFIEDPDSKVIEKRRESDRVNDKRNNYLAIQIIAFDLSRAIVAYQQKDKINKQVKLPQALNNSIDEVLNSEKDQKEKIASITNLWNEFIKKLAKPDQENNTNLELIRNLYKIWDLFFQQKKYFWLTDEHLRFIENEYNLIIYTAGTYKANNTKLKNVKRLSSPDHKDPHPKKPIRVLLKYIKDWHYDVVVPNNRTVLDMLEQYDQPQQKQEKVQNDKGPKETESVPVYISQTPKPHIYRLMFNKDNYKNFGLTDTEEDLYKFINKYFENRGTNKRVNYRTSEVVNSIKTYMKAKKLKKMDEFCEHLNGKILNKKTQNDFETLWKPLKKLRPYIDIKKALIEDKLCEAKMSLVEHKGDCGFLAIQKYAIDKKIPEFVNFNREQMINEVKKYIKKEESDNTKQTLLGAIFADAGATDFDSWEKKFKEKEKCWLTNDHISILNKNYPQYSFEIYKIKNNEFYNSKQVCYDFQNNDDAKPITVVNFNSINYNNPKENPDSWEALFIKDRPKKPEIQNIERKKEGQGNYDIEEDIIDYGGDEINNDNENDDNILGNNEKPFPEEENLNIENKDIKKSDMENNKLLEQELKKYKKENEELKKKNIELENKNNYSNIVNDMCYRYEIKKITQSDINRYMRLLEVADFEELIIAIELNPFFNKSSLFNNKKEKIFSEFKRVINLNEIYGEISDDDEEMEDDQPVSSDNRKRTREEYEYKDVESDKESDDEDIIETKAKKRKKIKVDEFREELNKDIIRVTEFLKDNDRWASRDSEDDKERSIAIWCRNAKRDGKLDDYAFDKFVEELDGYCSEDEIWYKLFATKEEQEEKAFKDQMEKLTNIVIKIKKRKQKRKGFPWPSQYSDDPEERKAYRFIRKSIDRGKFSKEIARKFAKKVGLKKNEVMEKFGLK